MTTQNESALLIFVFLFRSILCFVCLEMVIHDKRSWVTLDAPALMQKSLQALGLCVDLKYCMHFVFEQSAHLQNKQVVFTKVYFIVI